MIPGEVPAGVLGPLEPPGATTRSPEICMGSTGWWSICFGFSPERLIELREQRGLSRETAQIGFWRWCPNNGSGNYCQHGGWRFFGTITDTVHTDGDNVYSAVQVEAYNPNSYYGVQSGAKYQDWETYHTQEVLTQSANYRVCRDRSFPSPTTVPLGRTSTARPRSTGLALRRAGQAARRVAPWP